uniref:Uncharacterized protein n=1 Tax=Ixodes ricinus TaxID=34613 RepID=A0A0K8RMD2_IXORI
MRSLPSMVLWLHMQQNVIKDRRLTLEMMHPVVDYGWASVALNFVRFFPRLTSYASHEMRTLLRCDFRDRDLLGTCASHCGYWNEGMRCFRVAEARLKHVTPP